MGVPAKFSNEQVYLLKQRRIAYLRVVYVRGYAYYSLRTQARGKGSLVVKVNRVPTVDADKALARLHKKMPFAFVVLMALDGSILR